MSKTSRTFQASLKPSWSIEKIHLFLAQMIGTAKVWIINHDKDTNENGEIIESHTHIMLDYETPRKITTISNLLEVESNFIEIVRNKKGMLRYLTHMDDLDKHRYDFDEVYTNDNVSYELRIMGDNLSNREIAQLIVEGKGVELMDVVNPSKLRTIQSFIHFDNSNVMIREIKRLNEKMDFVVSTIEDAKTITDKLLIDFKAGVINSVSELVSGLNKVSTSLNRATNMVEHRKRGAR